MVRKEFIQMRRDRITLGMMVGLPAVQLALFGYAIRTEVRTELGRILAREQMVDAQHGKLRDRR